MKILVVDDDIIVIKSCRRILEAEGFEVTTCSQRRRGARENQDLRL